MAIDDDTPLGSRRARTRLMLLQAGAEVFARSGFRGTSLDEVGEAAGYTKGAIYDHFGSKEDFFFAVIEHRARERFVQFEEAIDAVLDGGVEVVTKQIATTLGQMMRPNRRGALLDAEAWLYAQRDEAARERLLAHQREQVDRIADLLQGIADATGSSLAMPARELALVLAGAAVGLTQLALLDHDLAIDQLFERMLPLGWSQG